MLTYSARGFIVCVTQTRIILVFENKLKKYCLKGAFNTREFVFILSNCLRTVIGLEGERINKNYIIKSTIEENNILGDKKRGRKNRLLESYINPY